MSSRRGWTRQASPELPKTRRRVVSTTVSASREIFREQVSLRLANIEAAARRALEVGGEAVIW